MEHKAKKIKIGEETLTTEGAELFLNLIEKMYTTHPNLSDREIADSFGLTTLNFRNKKAAAQRIKRNQQILEVRRMMAEGMSISEIADRINRSERVVTELSEKQDLYPTVIETYVTVRVE